MPQSVCMCTFAPFIRSNRFVRKWALPFSSISEHSAMSMPHSLTSRGKGVFQTPEVLRLPESGRGGYAVQLDDVVVEPVGSLDLSRTDLSGGFVVGNDCLGALPAG